MQFSATVEELLRERELYVNSLRKGSVPSDIQRKRMCSINLRLRNVLIRESWGV